MKRNMYQWLEELTRSNRKAALPIMTYPGLNMINKTVMDVITNGQSQYLCIEALAQKFPAAATAVIMDLSVEAEAFGSKIKYSENEVPTVIGKIIAGTDDAEKLKVPDVGEGRTTVYLNAARLAAENIKDRPTFAGHIGPFSLAGRLMDMTEIMIAMMEEPEIVHLVLEKCTTFLIEYSKAFKAVGANGVIIAEPAAGLLSPEKCDGFSSKYVKRIVEAVQDQEYVVILHNCGKTVKQVDTMISTGAKGLHFGNAVNMTDILPQVPDDRVAFGNIDPSGVFLNGTAEEMKTKVDTLLNAMNSYKNFVLSSGCDIPPGTPLDNIDAFFQALSNYNALHQGN
ncbi:uroporphyrinogen decarboxylase (uro-d) [Lucifera butyrica]|uniref:Uroporphyrinogen decarboxylase (Uro-d) n=1 Tax=Lucifera butyrica TaxID=1351585 RepID=A0A498R0W6_9FIRM|nr:uroporphyrinogen decarboxylase family protein [Lucifera butyrica]VBB04961.1 uroporphyrinogen decarboxylase (uro-d) [Lucifera butyrica]